MPTPEQYEQAMKRDADIVRRVMELRLHHPTLSTNELERQARKDIAYQRGEAANPEDMSRDEILAAMADPRNAEAAREYVTNGPHNPLEDISDDDFARILTEQDDRHRSNRIQKLREPFEDVVREAEQLHGKGSPLVPSVDDLLRQAAASAKTPKEGDPYREAMGWKPPKAPSLFAGDE